MRDDCQFIWKTINSLVYFTKALSVKKLSVVLLNFLQLCLHFGSQDKVSQKQNYADMNKPLPSHSAINDTLKNCSLH